MSFKTVLFSLLWCTSLTIFGHSTRVPRYKEIFFEKDHSSIEEIKKKIDFAIQHNDNSVDLRDFSGATLLICAIETGEPELVRYLIRKWHVDVTQPGVPQLDTSTDWQSTVQPLELATKKLELSETQEDHTRWEKIIHYLEKAIDDIDPSLG